MTNLSMDDVLKKARQAHKDKYGDALGEEMASRARLSHEAQLKKYGGAKGYSKEMKRRSSKRKAKDEVA